MTDSDILQPFYDYLIKERQALLTKLDAIERILGTNPRTAELRRRYKELYISENDTLAGVVKYDSK